MEAVNGIGLPVIDLSLFPKQNADQKQMQSQELNELRKACQELGFFLVINHGLNPSLVQAVGKKIRDMFSLPAEIKKKAIFPIYNVGYGPSVIDDVAKDSVPENMSFPWDHLLANSVENISAKLWPQGNPKFCEELNEYESQMRGLCHRILKLLVCSLGVDVSNKSASKVFEKCHGILRMNYYDKSTEKEMISKAHTDGCFITVLFQDDVGGLQIRTNEGKWVDTKPFSGSFVVNIGDILHMWSNGRYRSAEHRVIYGKSNRNRLSMAYFFDLPEEFEIRCPEETIDEEHPQIYKVVTKGEIAAQFKKLGPNMATPGHFRLQ